jgi:peptidylprolyl isomerase
MSSIKLIQYLILFVCLFAFIGACKKESTNSKKEAVEKTLKQKLIERGNTKPIREKKLAADADKTKQGASWTVPKSAPTEEKLKKTVKSKSGLQYNDIKLGRGKLPKKGDTIFIHFVAWLQNGNKQFRTTRGATTPYKFVLGQGQVIKGLEEGIASMKKGSIRKLMIPANLAYGRRGIKNKVPPQSDLIYEVELVSFNKTAK